MRPWNQHSIHLIRKPKLDAKPKQVKKPAKADVKPDEVDKDDEKGKE